MFIGMQQLGFNELKTRSPFHSGLFLLIAKSQSRTAVRGKDGQFGQDGHPSLKMWTKRTIWTRWTCFLDKMVIVLDKMDNIAPIALSHILTGDLLSLRASSPYTAARTG